MKVLVTGAAGFIGSRVAAALARSGADVLGLDSLNAYYDPRLKEGRLRACGITMNPEWPRHNVVPATGGDGQAVSCVDMPWGEVVQSTTLPRLRFLRQDITAQEAVEALFAQERFDVVVNLAAQAGVRYSLQNPWAYGATNVMGFLNILESSRRHGVSHVVYASSSSVYGLGAEVPYSEASRVDSPASLYAATKKADELMAHAYGALYGLPTTGLRYFTVYGPWGRPDMAPMLFARAILRGQPIRVFNEGRMARDFTYIDDIVEGTLRVVSHAPGAPATPPADSPAENEGGEPHADNATQAGAPTSLEGTSAAKSVGTREASAGDSVPARVFNIGHGSPVRLMDFISELEAALGREAQKEFLPMQKGDVVRTHADTRRLEAAVGYRPRIALHDGIRRFARWYQSAENPLR